MSTSLTPEQVRAELEAFMQAEPKFYNSLKLANPAQFVRLTKVIFSRLPDGHALSSHQVIGITYLDKVNLQNDELPFFKQDFVVRLPDGTFVSYTAPGFAKKANSPYVKAIGDFETLYGDGGKYYIRPGHEKPLVHHLPDVSDLLPDMQEEAKRLKQELAPKTQNAGSGS